jgi:hypothetical protein
MKVEHLRLAGRRRVDVRHLSRFLPLSRLVMVGGLGLTAGPRLLAKCYGRPAEQNREHRGRGPSKHGPALMHGVGSLLTTARGRAARAFLAARGIEQRRTAIAAPL